MIQTEHLFDTIILGSGISGTTLASILARQGYSVLLIEKGSHPRFAIGESMLPQTSMWMWITGEQFDVPEIKHLCHPKAVRQHIAATCGVKHSVGFVYHQGGNLQHPEETFQVIAPEGLFFSESHLFREDVDYYMLKVAQKYGVSYRDCTQIEEIELGEDNVTVRAKNGEVYQGRFLVDGSGYNSLVAKKLNLRENPPRLKTNSRTIFTHVTGLPAYDRCTTSPQKAEQRYGWHEGTLHHVFDGGWLWIIPFDNHSDAENRVSSIGLMLDINKFPKTDLSPEAEFKAIIAKFPSIAQHLANIKPVQRWSRVDRLQYSSRDCVGHRWAMLSHTYGFIDPLYSRGLISSFETIHALASRLLNALETDNFARENFSYLNRLQASQLENADQIISNAYRAMSHFQLWNAWTQLWLATKMLGDTYLFRSCLKYMDSGDLAFLSQLDEDPYPGVDAPFAEEIKYLIAQSSKLLDRVEAQILTPEEGAEGILQLLKQAESLPKSIYPWGTSTARYIDFNLIFGEWIAWGKTEAPMTLQKNLFDFQLLPAAFAA